MSNRSNTRVEQSRKVVTRQRKAKVQLPAAATVEAPSVAAEAASLPPNHSRRPKPSSKLGIVLGLMEAPDGATLSQLVEVTAWLPHTTRAALTGLRKRGFAVIATRTDADRTTRYRIGPETA